MPDVYPVHGRVIIDGKPTEFVNVSLIRCDSKDLMPVSIAVTNNEGEFHLTTNVEVGIDQKIRRLEGVEPGEYFVRLSYPQPIRPRASEPEFGPELLPEAYLKPETSGRPELKVTIEAANNEIGPFEIQRNGAK